MEKRYREGQTFSGENFRQTTIENYEFEDCDFENCRFEECKIIRCTFKNCRFYNCTVITLTSQYSEVKNVSLKKCSLIGVHWEELLPSGRYGYVIEKMETCYLKYNTFADMAFRKFTFSDNAIQESIFQNCDLTESSFRCCVLEGTQFEGCDIRKADFRESSGYLINITTNKIKNAKFSYPEVIRLLDALEIQIE